MHASKTKKSQNPAGNFSIFWLCHCFDVDAASLWGSLGCALLTAYCRRIMVSLTDLTVHFEENPVNLNEESSEERELVNATLKAVERLVKALDNEVSNHRARVGWIKLYPNQPTTLLRQLQPQYTHTLVHLLPLPTYLPIQNAHTHCVCARTI
jgi:hypothetical protein